MISCGDKLLESFCGVDEAGRGPWAGPVVASVVCLPKNHNLRGLDDSKKLSPNKRFELYKKILVTADVGIGFASVKEIDQYNILQATFIAMRRAINNLEYTPNRILIDGNSIPPGLPGFSESIIKGDTKVASIAAASIVAKVTRDRFMEELSLLYPGYGWERNFGYGVREHQEALKVLGVTSKHRRSFKPIHNILC